MPRHGGRSQGNKRRFDDQQYEGAGPEEPVMDDLIAASMAANSTWLPTVDDSIRLDSDDDDDSSSDSDDEDSSDSDEEDSSDSDKDSSSSDDDESKDGGDDGKVEEKKTDGSDAAPTGDGDGNSASEASKAPIDGEDSDSEDSKVNNDISNLNETVTAMEDNGNTAVKDGIDPAEHLENMEDGDDLPSSPNKRRGKKKKANKNANPNPDAAPMTEHEIDPYRCPTDELEKLTVGVGSTEQPASLSITRDADGALIVDANIKKKLKIAGTIRSYIAGKRTVVVDSFISFNLQSHNNHASCNPLDEGSMLVVITKQNDEDGKHIVVPLNEVDDNKASCSLHLLGKIMEVFGPVQRPLYAIRFPDPPRAKVTKGKVGVDAKAEDSTKDGDEVMFEGDSKVEEVADKEGGDGKDVELEVDAKVQDSAKNEDEIMPEEDSKVESGDEKEGSDGKDEVDANAQDSTENEDETKLEEDSKMESVEEKEGSASDPTDNGADEPTNPTDSKSPKSSDCETEKKSPSEKKAEEVEDPWAPDGKLSIMLQSCPQAAVYFLMDHAKLIDTDHVIRVSGKGCDASNMFDEEAGASEQQYYSDDEEERLAKRKGKNRGPPRQSDNDQGDYSGRGRGGGRVGGRGGSGRDGRGRGGRGGGRGRSQQQHGNGAYGSSGQHMQQQQHPRYQQQHPPSYRQQQTPSNAAYSHISGLPPSFQQGTYQQPQQQQYQQQYQHQQYQPQYQQQQYQQQQPYYGGQQPHQFAPQGQPMMHGVPPPPPQPRGNVPAQMPGTSSAQHSQSWQTSQAQQQPPASDNDTVYYNY